MTLLDPLHYDYTQLHEGMLPSNPVARAHVPVSSERDQREFLLRLPVGELDLRELPPVPVEVRITNLQALADYLDRLPEDYQGFDMPSYTSAEGPEILSLFAAPRPEGLAECSTTACALGHGPLAGISARDFLFLNLEEAEFNPGDLSVVSTSELMETVAIDWDAYSYQFIEPYPESGGYSYDFEFLFGGAWASRDNTARGAAARIRCYLTVGVPAEYDVGNSKTYSPSIYASYLRPTQSTPGITRL